MHIICYVRNVQLSLVDRTCRTCTCARTAVDALVCVDFEFAITHADSSYWTLSFTSSTTNTSVRNLVCHNVTSSLSQRATYYVGTSNAPAQMVRCRRISRLYVPQTYFNTTMKNFKTFLRKQTGLFRTAAMSFCACSKRLQASGRKCAVRKSSDASLSAASLSGAVRS